MSHPEFLERMFEGQKGEEGDKKDLQKCLTELCVFVILLLQSLRRKPV